MLTGDYTSTQLHSDGDEIECGASADHGDAGDGRGIQRIEATLCAPQIVGRPRAIASTTT